MANPVVGICRITGSVEPLVLGRGLVDDRAADGGLNHTRQESKDVYEMILRGESGSIPSWTQGGIGKYHAYVIPTLSSSDDFTFRFNTFVSGS